MPETALDELLAKAMAAVDPAEGPEVAVLLRLVAAGLLSRGPSPAMRRGAAGRSAGRLTGAGFVLSQNDTIPVRLSAPVKCYDETVSEVAIRRPTSLELRQCGQPYVVVGTGGGGVKADYEACAKLLTLVCTPPLTSMAVDALDAADFDDMAMVLVGFTKRARPGASANGSQPTD